MNFITEKVKAWQTTEIQLPSPLPPGEYDIIIRAIDEFGIDSAPVKVRVVVKAPPKVKLLSPTDGCVVSQTPTLVVRAEDAVDCYVKFIVSVVPARGESPEEKVSPEEENSPEEERRTSDEVPLTSPEPCEYVTAGVVDADTPDELEGNSPRGQPYVFFRKGGS